MFHFVWFGQHLASSDTAGNVSRTSQISSLQGLNHRELRGDPSQEGVLGRRWNDSEIKSGDIEPAEDLAKSIWRRGLPGVVLAASDKVAWDRGTSYIDTYIHRGTFRTWSR
jgi:hypothetical protein